MSMIPHLSAQMPAASEYQLFLENLQQSSFQGDISVDLARRLVSATDNSVYQLLPQAIIYPKNHQDLVLILSTLNQAEFRQVCISPRGGGTGTNGQSLTQGISVDLSRYMNQILEINIAEGWARVQAGVVLDRLNEQLKQHHVFFAPNLSPSNRATIGGMVNTDAAGKGSRIYGKTSDHILHMKTVVLGGKTISSEKMSIEKLKNIPFEHPTDETVNYALPILDLVDKHHMLIGDVFPKLSRFMTGYNLAMYRQDQSIDLNRIIAGSEGTLGIVSDIKVKLTPLPKAKKLVLFRYQSFSDALGSAQLLLQQNPSAIETIDDNILTLAKDDIIYHSVKAALEATTTYKTVDGSTPMTKAINLVEFEGVDEDTVSHLVERCIAQVRPYYGEPNAPIADYVAHADQEQNALWNLRKKGVGLLAARPGKRKPIAFVEDTVVPPQHLKSYIKDFTALLDAEGVEYGLFGHVDVGCLHVRPALDLKDPEDEARFKRISDQVATLVREYGGLIWGEHGKGIRSAYSPEFFVDLYPVLQEVKALFDPYNQLNPGKIATPARSSAELLPIDSPLRAQQDRKIQAEALDVFAHSVHCNGNGLCFNDHPDQIMCPSATVTRDRLHSPKGRATVMRAWLKSLSEAGYQFSTRALYPLQSATPPHLFKIFTRWIMKYMRRPKQSSDFSSQVQEAMAGCLSCKACATHCPVKVDIPEFKSHFLYLYHQRYPRPMRDYLVGSLEGLAYYLSKFPSFSNLLMHNPITRLLNHHIIGLLDAPRFATPSSFSQAQKTIPLATAQSIQQLSSEQRKKAVILIPDTFHAYFDAHTWNDICQLLKLWGFYPMQTEFQPQGKGWHVKGMLDIFRKTAIQHSQALSSLNASDIPMVAVDPAIALMYRDEYQKLELDETKNLSVFLLSEWLSQHLEEIVFHHEGLVQRGSSIEDTDLPTPYLFAHCTERTAIADSPHQWSKLFQAIGIALELATVACCGMCGVYGHEKEHYQSSKELYQMSWQKKIHQASESCDILTTGYSCRSQVKRFDSLESPHPLSWIYKYYHHVHLSQKP